MLPYMGGGMPVVGGRPMTHNAGSVSTQSKPCKANRRKIFCENGFHTLQGTMFQQTLTNASSLKIAAA